MKDKLGREIKIGQRVAYAVSVRRSAVLRLGAVENITENTVVIKGDGRTNVSRISHVHNIVILEEPNER